LETLPKIQLLVIPQLGYVDKDLRIRYQSFFLFFF